MIKERDIRRGVVHIVANEHGGVLYVENDNTLSLRIQQKEVWKDSDGKMNSCTKTAGISGTMGTILSMDYKLNQRLPDNIRIVEQTEQVVEDDPEEFLYWNEEGTEVHRDSLGRAIYRYQEYYPNESFKPKGEIDTFLI